MKPKEFLTQVDDARVIQAISEAEKLTSGEIRVYVANSAVNDPVLEAEKQFLKLGMNRTEQRNGVLIFIAPVSQNYAVVGDEGIHKICGQEFWEKTSSEMVTFLKQGQYTEAILSAIRNAAGALSKHFPRRPDDRNELSNEIARG